MDFISLAVAYCETTAFFQAELLLLLASIILYFKTNYTKLFFISSGVCLFTALGIMIYELSRGWPAHMINAETMTTTVLSGMLFATFVASVTTRMRAFVVYTHAATALALCVCLGVGVGMAWMALAPLPDAQLEQSKTRPAVFSAMHLVASTLVVAESLSGRASTGRPEAVMHGDFSSDREYDFKVCALA